MPLIVVKLSRWRFFIGKMKRGLTLDGGTAQMRLKFLRSICALSVGLHAIMAVGLCTLSIPSLSAAYAMSALYYVAAYFVIRRFPYSTLWVVIGALLQVFACSSAAIYYLGWASGFNYYILTAAVVVATLRFPRWQCILLTLGLCIGHFLLDHWLHPHTPTTVLTEQWLTIVRSWNTAAVLVSIAFCADRYQRLHLNVDQRLKQLAHTDPLTGLANRFRLIEQSQQLRCKKRHQESAIIIGDIDHFKSFNDRYGHSVGDIVIQAAAKILQQSFNDKAILCRWGGEEFIVLLRDTSLTQAVLAAMHARLAIEQAAIVAKSFKLNITITFGVTQMLPHENLLEAIDRADRALYQGKREGRNCVRSEAPPSDTAPPCSALGGAKG